MKEKINDDQIIHQHGHELFSLMLEKLKAEKKRRPYSTKRSHLLFKSKHVVAFARQKVVFDNHTTKS